MRTLGRRPKRRMQPKGAAEIAENNLAIRPSKALKKKNVGEDPELEEFLDALPKEPTSSLLEALQTLGRRPKRRMQPVLYLLLLMAGYYIQTSVCKKSRMHAQLLQGHIASNVLAGQDRMVGGVAG